MRLISSLCSFLLLVSQVTFANNDASHHRYPGSKETVQTIKTAQDAKPAFYSCEIEIVNDSFSNVTVYGRYDDGVPLNPFNVYSYEYSHYIDLFYNGYCHSGMYLSVVTFSGYTIFSGYVFTGSTIHVVPSLNKQLKVTVEKP
jgi:hypothetical protein